MELDFSDLNQLVVIHTGFYVKTTGGAYDFVPADSSITPYVWRLGQIPEEFRTPDFLMAPPVPKMSTYSWTPPVIAAPLGIVPPPVKTATK